MIPASAESETTGRTRPPGPPSRYRVKIAIAAMGIGLALAVIGVGYILYAEIARSQLDDLVYEVSQTERTSWLTAPAPGSSISENDPDSPPGAADPGDASRPTTEVADPVDAAQLFPARWTNPRFWAEPEWAGSLPYGRADLPEGFEYVNPAQIISESPSPGAAETLEIPAIGLATFVYELTLYGDEGNQFWESPVDIVGHIPGTASPGAAGAGWYFGHLQSPVRGEGNVFHDLPDVVDLIKHDPVDIIIGNESGEYLYRVTGTGFIHRDDLVLEQTTESTVTLVASYPKLVYDHRLLVNGELLAFRPRG